MMPEGPKSCRLEDRVEYELPLGFVGNLLASWFVHKKLQKLFRYRHNVTAEAMAERSSKSETPEVT
jgi:ligand-binding SRPBCC domain-containing protein